MTNLEIVPTNVLCTTLEPLQIPNLANTCYFNTLVQSIFWVVPLRKALMDYKTLKIDKGIQPIFLLGEEVTSKNCLACLKQMKTLLRNMKENITRLNKHKLKKDMIKILGYLGLSHFDSQCVNEVWIQLFQTYFEYIKCYAFYTVEISTVTHEVVEPGTNQEAKEHQNPQTASLLYINEADLKSKSLLQSIFLCFIGVCYLILYLLPI
jgi:hypothetical protein